MNYKDAIRANSPAVKNIFPTVNYRPAQGRTKSRYSASKVAWKGCLRQTAIVLWIVALYSCSPFMGTFGKQAPCDPGQSLLSRIQTVNSDLVSFKGIGNLYFENQGRRQTVRAAWMGSVTGQLRVEILAPSGQSSISLAVNEKYIYIEDHLKTRFIKRPVNDPNIKRLMPLEVPIQDVTTLLAGRIPICEYAQVCVQTDPASGGVVLALKNSFSRTIQILYLDKEKERVWKIERFGLKAKLAYRVEFENRRQIDRWYIPMRLLLTNDKGTFITLEIERYWENVAVEPSMFKLVPRKG